MIDLKKLLICDGRPSKEMIDYIVDSNIQKMVEEFAYSISHNSNRIGENSIIGGYLNVEKDHNLYTHFSIVSYPQYCSEVFNDVKKSIQRYESFVSVCQGYQDPFEQANRKPNVATLTEFTLNLRINPEMKKAFLLEQELTNNNQQNKKLKI